MLIYRFNKEMAQIELYHSIDDDEPYEVIELDTAVWLYKNVVRCKECIWRDKDNQGDDYCIYVKGLADINEYSFCS